MLSRGALTTHGVLLAATALLAAGCGGSTSVAQTPYEDPHPVPEDAMVVATDEIGSYGGRFVIGQTNEPKTFNHTMANETSSITIRSAS